MRILSLSKHLENNYFKAEAIETMALSVNKIMTAK
jgi:hypothetical protein